MSEIQPEVRIIRRYESPLYVEWKKTNQPAVAELVNQISTHNLQLPEPLAAFRGGGIMEPAPSELAPGYKKFLSSERSMAVIPVKEESGGKLTDVVHFPVTKETGPIRFDANLAAYKYHVGQYVYEHWDKNAGPPPLTQVRSVDELPDGRFMTIDRYRPYLHGLGKGAGSLGIHELDTTRLTIDETKSLVQVLDAAQPPAKDFAAWIAEKQISLPKESLLHPEHPLTALRGQEWWIGPEGLAKDRLHELGTKITGLEKEFAAIDPVFKPKEALEQMIRNNVTIFPHQDGHTDSVEQANALHVVHGALYPDNIHRSQTPDRTKTYFTITGGDRSHIGLAAESVDWLITAAAESPAHQEALISEFLKLHPSEIDKRGLAMHVVYRTLSEASWFANAKGNERQNLAKLTYDLLNGNGVWKNVNTPYKIV